MRIKEIHIDNYGNIIRNRYFKPEDMIHIIYGPNESGKTLTVEAITRMLFKWTFKEIGKNFRVYQSPSGSITLTDDGKDIILDGKKDFLKEYDIERSDAENVFLIRDSDLNVDIEYCAKITDKLIGFEAQRYNSIKEILAKQGKLTKAVSDSDISNRSPDYQRNVLDELSSISRAIDEYLNEQKNSGIDEKESKYLLKIYIHSEIKKRVDELDIAYKKKTYLTSNILLDKIKKIDDELSSLVNFTDEDFKTITDTSLKYQETLKDIEKNGKTLNENELKLKKLMEDKNLLDEEASPYITKKDDLQNIESKVDRIRDDERDLAPLNINNYNRIGYVLMIVSLILFLIVIFLRYPLLIIFPSTVFLSGLYLILRKVIDPREKIGVSKQILVQDACHILSLNCNSYNDMLSNLSIFKSSIKDYSLKIENLEKKEIIPLQTSMQILRGAIISKEADKKGYEETIKAIIDRTNVKNVKEYEKKKNRKSELNLHKQMKIASLDDLFDTKDSEYENKKRIWKSKLEELSEYKDIEIKEYSEKEEEELKIKLSELEKELGILNEELKPHRDSLTRFEIDLARFKIADSIPNLKVLEDIKIVVDEKIQNIENKRDVSKKAIGIIEEIEKEEREKTTELFGKDKEVSKYFNKITEGRFISVELVNDEDNGKIINVLKNNGDVIEDKKLSKGTFDQLYLSIRLAIAEKLLGGRKGFFVMDDPFVFSDTKRIKEQFNILDKISKEGWNILYFTSKDEVKQIAQERNYSLEELAPLE